MHPNIRLALKLSVTPLVLVVTFSIVSTAKLAPEVSELSEVISSDGQRVARLVYVVYAGHLTGDPARHEVFVGNSTEPRSSQAMVFAAEGGDFKLEWSGKRELRVSYSSAARIEIQQPRTGDVNIQYGVAGW